MKKALLMFVAASSLAAVAARIQMPPSCSTPDGMTIDPKGRLVIAGANVADRSKQGAIFRLDSPGQAPVKWFDVPKHPATGIASPMGVNFAPDGALYVCDNQDNCQARILRFTFNDDDTVATCETVAEGLENANGVKYLDGKLYMTQAIMTKIKNADGSLGSAVYCFDATKRNQHVTNTAADPEMVFRDSTTNSNCKVGLNGMAIDSKKNIYTGNYGDGTIWRLSPRADGTFDAKVIAVATPENGLKTPDGLCVDAADNLYIADMFAYAAHRITPAGKFETLMKNDPKCPDGLLRPSEPCVWNGRLYLSNWGGTTVYELPLSSVRKGGQAPEWIDAALKQCAENYTVLLEAANRELGKEKPYPKTFKDGKRVFCADWDWCSGFFQGSMWYLYEATGDVKWREAAEKWCEEQAHIRTSNLHHDLGFMFLTSAGNGYRLTGNEKYAQWMRDAALALATRYRPNAKLIQSWGLWQRGWHCPVIIDNMLNLELLEWAAKHPDAKDAMGGSLFREIAVNHADATAKNHFRSNGSVYHIADYDPNTGKVLQYLSGQGYSAEKGVWSRGQAWAIYGFTMMYRETGKIEYLQTAMRAADWALAAPKVPADRIPYWDYGAPNIPNEERDSSGAAVMACGFLELSDLCPDAAKAAKYRAEAETMAKSLASPAYLAQADEIGGFLLKHAVGGKPMHSEIDVPENYGDYYFLELLLKLKKNW